MGSQALLIPPKVIQSLWHESQSGDEGSNVWAPLLPFKKFTQSLKFVSGIFYVLELSFELLQPLVSLLLLIDGGGLDWCLPSTPCRYKNTSNLVEIIGQGKGNHALSHTEGGTALVVRYEPTMPSIYSCLAQLMHFRARAITIGSRALWGNLGLTGMAQDSQQRTGHNDYLSFKSLLV